jgi:flagellar biosynthetic protein FliR
MVRDDEVIRLLGQLPLCLPAYALVLFRVAGLMVTAPLFGTMIIPVRIRAAIAMVIALALFPVVSATAPATLTFREAVVGVVGETIIGVSMGLALSLVLVGTDLAGMVAGQQAGLALGREFNPMTNAGSTVFGQTYFMVFQTVFLLAGGHRALMEALLDTFQVIPLASFRAGPSVVELLVDLLTAAFVLGLKLAAPILIALFLTSVSMGFLSKTMPQLNILSVGFALRAMLAMGAASVAIPAAHEVFLEALTDSIVALRDAFALGPSSL